ncbi:TPA: Na+/H+ antiporter Mnh2 subunit E, partial [Staphylococcus aureus]|nr:Na+/H+ antiporter Mnh2 subunit E [Staphylococcus aureus]
KTKDMNPGLLSYETRLTSDWAITFLTILIIITPGSTVIRISQDSKKFFIHSIDVSEKEKEKDSLLRSIKHYEDLILEVSR